MKVQQELIEHFQYFAKISITDGDFSKKFSDILIELAKP